MADRMYICKPYVVEANLLYLRASRPIEVTSCAAIEFAVCIVDTHPQAYVLSTAEYGSIYECVEG